MSLLRLAALLVCAAAMIAPAAAQAPTAQAPAAPAPAGQGSAKPGQAQKPAGGQREKQFPVPSNWTAVSLNGKPFGGRDRPTFSLDQQYRAKGFGGCNTYSATSYPLREQRLAVGPVRPHQEAMRQGGHGDGARLSGRPAHLHAMGFRRLDAGGEDAVRRFTLRALDLTNRSRRPRPTRYLLMRPSVSATRVTTSFGVL